MGVHIPPKFPEYQRKIRSADYFLWKAEEACRAGETGTYKAWMQQWRDALDAADAVEW